jgi:hypothetical protein
VTELIIKIRKDSTKVIDIDGTITRNKFFAFKKINYSTVTYSGWFIRFWCFLINISINKKPFA